MAAAVCICLQAACKSGALDERRLTAVCAAAGLRVRKVAAAAADLLLCKAGQTLAFMLWPAAGGAAGAEPRITRLAASFKQCFVLVPHALLGDATVLDAAARFGGAEPPVTFVFMPLGADFGERALAVGAALLAAEAEAPAWRQQQAETVQSLEAAAQPLQGLLQAAASAGDAAHSASMLLTLGSLQDISRRQGDEIAALTDLDHATAAACAAFFQGRAARPTPHGLPLGVPLQHL